MQKDLPSSYLKKYGAELSAETFDMLDRFAELLSQWNKKFNLTAITEPEAVAQKHLLDSLSIFEYIDFPQGASVIDVGCGAGFPSLPMLIARKDLNMTFLDSTRKKLVFIEAVLEELGLNGTTLHLRAEEAAKKEYRESFDFAVARAVAPLRTLCEYTLPFVKHGGYFAAMKGKEAEAELREAENALNLLGGKKEDVFSFSLPDGSLRSIILIKKVSHISSKYPRASSVILKKPL